MRTVAEVFEYARSLDRRACVYVPLDRGCVVVIEGHPQFFPIADLPVDDPQKWADAFNRVEGLTPLDVSMIVASSMRSAPDTD